MSRRGCNVRTMNVKPKSERDGCDEALVAIPGNSCDTSGEYKYLVRVRGES